MWNHFLPLRCPIQIWIHPDCLAAKPPLGQAPVMSPDLWPLSATSSVQLLQLRTDLKPWSEVMGRFFRVAWKLLAPNPDVSANLTTCLIQFLISCPNCDDFHPQKNRSCFTPKSSQHILQWSHLLVGQQLALARAKTIWNTPGIYRVLAT